MPLLDSRDLRQTFRTRLLLLPGLPPISYQDRPFDQKNVSNSPPHYIEEASTISSETQASSGLNMALGIYRFDVKILAGHGTETAEDLTKTIADQFPPKLSLASATQCFQLYETSRLTPTPDVETDEKVGWIRHPVAILWRAFTAN